MDEPIEDLYFNWLCSKVLQIDVSTPSLTYWTLFKKLYSTEFVFLLAGDDNRAEDGTDLRIEFLREFGLDGDENWLKLPCSILEMLVAFCVKHASFQTDISAQEWFWTIMGNMGLKSLNDSYQAENLELFDEVMDEILSQFVWRTYEPSGLGGLFPLEEPRNDQRDVEIWYQFFQYLKEHEEI